MKPRLSDGRVERLAPEKDPEHHLEVRRDDPRASRGSPHESVAARVHRDRRTHRGEHPLPGRDLVDLALDEAVHVLLTGPRGEVVHLVVPEEPEARRDAGVPERVVERRRHADGVACCIDDGEMSRVRLVRLGSAKLLRRRRLLRVDGRSDLAHAEGIREEVLPHSAECGVSEVTVPVGKRALFHFRHQVRGSHVARLQLVRSDRVGEQRQLREHRTRGGSGRRVHVVTGETEAKRDADLRLVSREIAAADQTPLAALAGFDAPRDVAAVEAVLSAIADRDERRREVRLLEHRPRNGRRAARKKDPRRLRVLREAVLRRLDGLRDVLRHRESVARKADGGLDDVLPGKAPSAAVRGGEPGDGAGHTRRERSFRGGRRGPRRTRTRVQILPGIARSDLAVVHDDRAAVRVPGDPEPPAPEVARLRPRDSQRERRRHRGVRGVAASLENADAHARGGSLLRGDRASDSAADDSAMPRRAIQMPSRLLMRVGILWASG